jgi:uncharacterized membrane protein YheB (UPF0754 family)
MNPDKEIALLSKLVSDLFKKVDKDALQSRADIWERSVELRAYCENITDTLQRYIEDDRITEFVKDFIDEIIHEFADLGTFGNTLKEFKDYLIDSIEEFTNENELKLDITSIVEGILNGIDVKQTMVFEGYRRVRLR